VRLARLVLVSSANRKPAQYRGRIAPSPTGYLHVGHARTFWTAFERVRDAGGTLVMRMEDLDRERSKSTYAAAAMEDLRWLGMEWQEGPDVGGPGDLCPFGPYTQSERGGLYRAAWRALAEGGFLFPCRCSRKDLETAAAAPHESGMAKGTAAGNAAAEMDALDEAQDREPVYPGTCRAPLHGADLWTSDLVCEANWRFRVPDGEAIEFVDGNLGPQRFVAGVDFGDFLVWRRDGAPSYQLACVVDDAAMQITEVVRGADLLKSTARQILLNRALGYANPAWFHCALMVDRNGRRLAKRHDALSLRTLRERGLTPAEVLSGALPEEAR
jgi:glutamyl/glutaminyl-tRNA synthetase